MIDKEWNDCDQVNSHLFFFIFYCLSHVSQEQFKTNWSDVWFRVQHSHCVSCMPVGNVFKIAIDKKNSMPFCSSYHRSSACDYYSTMYIHASPHWLIHKVTTESTLSSFIQAVSWGIFSSVSNPLHLCFSLSGRNWASKMTWAPGQEQFLYFLQGWIRSWPCLGTSQAQNGLSVGLPWCSWRVLMWPSTSGTQWLAELLM